MNFIANWHWPQFVFVALLLLRLAIYAASNGEPMLKPDKKTPREYSFAAALFGAIVTVFILTAGGFFG